MSSYTAALQLSMLAGVVGPGDEVVTTPLTFCSPDAWAPHSHDECLDTSSSS